MARDAVNKIQKELNIEGSTLIVGAAENSFNIKKFDSCDAKELPQNDYNLVVISSKDQLNNTARIIWNNTSYGGYVVITDVTTPQIETRILAFLKAKQKYYFRKRRMMVNGTREQFLCFKIFNPNKRKPVIEQALSQENKNIKIACVLRSSKDYSVRDINMLAKNVKKHFTQPYEFVAITDSQKNIDTGVVDRVIPVKYKYPSWWCKIELFRPDVFEHDDRIIYFDLDTAIVDNIDFMANQNESFVGLRDFYNMFNFASGVMSWVGAAGYHLHDMFEREHKTAIAKLREGDQKFISQNLDGYTFWQDLFPSKIISFKKDMKEQHIQEIPEEASVICFHGKPKLFDCNNRNILKAINN